MLIKPNGDKLDIAFNRIINTYTGNLLVDDLMDEHKQNKISIRYKAKNSSNSPEIEAQVSYFKAFDWYTIVAVPVEEIQEPAMVLISRQSIIIISIFLGSLIAAFYMMSKISKPLNMLTEYAKELPLLDFTQAQEEENHPIEALPSRYNDEVGRLAEAFIFMKGEGRKGKNGWWWRSPALERWEV